jgi:hypothetical protein
MADQQQPQQQGNFEDLTDILASIATSHGFPHLAQCLAAVHAAGNVNNFPNGCGEWLKTALADGANPNYNAALALIAFTNYQIDRANKTIQDNVAEREAVQADLVAANDDNVTLQNQLATAQSKLVKALEAQLQNQAPTTHPIARKALMKDPDRFTGEEKDAIKRHDAFVDWKDKVLLRWRQDSHDFPTEFSKILHASGLLTGRASQGIQAELRRVLDNEDDDAEWPWKTGTELLDALTAKYNTLDLQLNAEQRLHNLTQSNEFSLYADFINEFQQLADRAGWSDTVRIFHLQNKVNRKMRDAIGVQMVLPAKDDLPGWLRALRTLATRKEQEAFAASNWKAQQPHGGGNNSGNNSSGNNNNTKGHGDPGTNAGSGEPMDLSRLSLSVEERNRRIKNQLCMYCGGNDHFRADCRIAQPSRGGRGGRGGYTGRGGQRGGRGGFTQPGQDQYTPTSYQYSNRSGNQDFNNQYPTRGSRGNYSSHGGFSGHGSPSPQYPSHLRQTDSQCYTPEDEGSDSHFVPQQYQAQPPTPVQPPIRFPPSGHVIGTISDSGTTDQGKGEPSY